MKSLFISFLLASHLCPILLLAQAEQRRLAFEVASIAPADPTKPPLPETVRSDPGRVTFRGIQLKFLTMRAYNIRNYQFSGPAWMETQRVDVNAKIPEGVATTETPAMLQTLLAERFGQRVHWETRVESGYALIVDKNGPKLKKSDESSPFMVKGVNGGRTTGSFISVNHLELGKISMTRFAGALSGYIDQSVMDMTNLPGYFDIVLDVDPSTLPGLVNLLQLMPGSVERDPTRGSIFTEVQQLGLKLVARKIPVEHLMIDHMDKVPTEN